MNANEIRQTFLDFFKSKQHVIVPSAPMVVKNDPTLMFTNAGMNQFKDLFLGNSPIVDPRVADTQKCLRVSGKHNDLEEVGIDTYHHTMFEMLGNWSFGDYFKKDAINWAWELLADIYKIDKSRMYATYFGGDPKESLEPDTEAQNLWKQFLPDDHVLPGSKKDNFWEMGDTGPCGPCSEIHVDIRSDEERKQVDGRSLVNESHPQVIEIWNLVFIQFNRKANGSLEKLAAQHVDTGMGFERLCMVLQGKRSNYDTDVFQPIISKLGELSGKTYGKDEKTDIALRVIADHLRTICFAITDGQLPSNNKAGYVIRRILRRAVRYGYTFLNFKEPFMFELIPVLVSQMKHIFPEIEKQQDLIRKVMIEEEQSFLRTLATGIDLFEQYYMKHHQGITKKASEKSEFKDIFKPIDGQFAFELFDTYGFPIDLTQLLAREKNLEIDMEGFNKCLEEQKNRSRNAATVDTGDWTIIIPDVETEFIGYDALQCEVKIARYRQVKSKQGEYFQVVLNKTPFYAESGGQAGDIGTLELNEKLFLVDNTIKENQLIIHLMKKIPDDLNATLVAKVNPCKRGMTARNHTATHLLHSALREVLGTHVEQKGSLVTPERLRFDFAHFSKMSDEEIAKVEYIVNKKIRQNIALEEHRAMPIAEANSMGAMALFGEKYGNEVRVIVYDKNYSVELCGGTHVAATGNIGLFKIVSEGAIAAGVRRIEAISGAEALKFYNEQTALVEQVSGIYKNSKDIVKNTQELIEKVQQLEKEVQQLKKEKALLVKDELKQSIKQINGINLITAELAFDVNIIKDLAYALKSEVQDMVLVIGNIDGDKANLTVMISEELVQAKGLNASTMVRELAKEIQGGGGGQPFFATAGGKNPQGLSKALAKAESLL